MNPITQMKHVAARQNLTYLNSRLIGSDIEPLNTNHKTEWYMFAMDRRLELVCVWHIAFDLDQEMTLATELFQFDPKGPTVPDCLLGDSVTYMKWREAVRADVLSNAHGQEAPYASYLREVGNVQK